MSVNLTRMDSTEQAVAAAEAAAATAGLALAEIDDITTLETAARLFDEVWSSSGEAPLISPSTLKALAHSGNYIAGAFRDGTLAGALVGFLGLHDDALLLHSHILGVSPEVQDRNIGFTLKQHQRGWALARGIGTVTWTFDPLVRRNAYFNLTKLGAAITTYYENFYGDMNDGVNAGDESDRVLVEWALAAPRVVDLSRSHGLEPDVDVLRKEGAVVALEASDVGPLVREDANAATLLVQVPENIVSLRERDRTLAHEWRFASRQTLGSALRNGYVATGMTRSGWYVLTDRRR